MGETWEDRLDMAVSLAEVGVDSIPINALMPISGTPLEGLERLTEPEILRTVAFSDILIPRQTYDWEQDVHCLPTMESLHSSQVYPQQLPATCSQP